MRAPRCRCGSRSLILTEVCEELGQIEQLEDGSLRSFDGHDSETLTFAAGFVTCVRAQCRKCAHGWTLRSIRQITDHPGHTDNVEVA